MFGDTVLNGTSVIITSEVRTAIAGNVNGVKLEFKWHASHVSVNCRKTHADRCGNNQESAYTGPT
jgi:hypothetical protein